MNVRRSRALRWRALLALLACATSLRAQAPLEPGQLPARTVFYLVWRGAPDPAVRQANSLLSLWDDPDFAPVRASLIEGFLSNSDKTKENSILKGTQQEKKSPGLAPSAGTRQRFSRKELEEFLPLLDNAFLLGYYSEPESSARSAAGAASGKASRPWNGIFFLYDRSGKEALLAKAFAGMAQDEKEPPQILRLTVAGVAALEFKRKTGSSFWAETGKFAVGAQEKSVFEDILKRVLRKSPADSETALGATTSFREAQPALATGSLLELFLRVPSLKELAREGGTAGGQLLPALESLHLDSIHSLTVSLMLDGPRTRIQGALLGDASQGSLLDIWPNGSETPAIASFAPAETVSLNETQINLPAILEIVRRAGRSFSPPGQSGMSAMVENAIQTRIGMPPDEALRLFTGEFASVQSSPDFDPARQIHVIGIRNKPETLKFLRTLLSDRIISERNEGGTTFLKISLSGAEGSAGAVQWNFYQLAVTPDLIVGAQRSDFLRAALAQRAQSAAGGLFTLPKFQELRQQFPKEINGIAYLDFQRVNWQAVKDRWIADAGKTNAAHKSGPGRGSSAPPVPEWLEKLNPGVLSRHLHTGSSASWKNSKGLRFDAWID